MAKTKLYLFAPAISDAATFAPLLEAALSAAPFEAALLGVAANAGADAEKALKALLPLVQKHGAAALVLAPEDLREVARLGADGVHLPVNSSRVKDTLEELKPDRIVGIGELRTKHEMMEAGECEVDYLMIGEPRPDGSIMPIDKVIERAAWWSEVFTLPCVAYAPDLASVAPLAATGVDFVALGSWIFEAGDPAAVVTAARGALAVAV